jgi:2-oxoglutarate dehydrogenase E2 component (dihydrolipoamide succinyltransferase)
MAITLKKDQEIGEIESDKATLPIIAEVSGAVKLLHEPGDTVKVGEIVCSIDDSVSGGSSREKPEVEEIAKEEKAETKAVEEKKPEKQPETPATKKEKPKTEHEKVKVTPLAQKLMDEKNLSLEDVLKGIERISKSTIEAVSNLPQESNTTSAPSSDFVREQQDRIEDRERMSQLRKKIAKRLVAVKNETAMLTTFNEVDMSAIMAMRKQYQNKFVEAHGVKLGFMSFFTKAASIALKAFPKVNSMMDGEEIITPNYTDIGIAVQTNKGLMVPVLRDIETKGLADIEKEIIEKAGLARKGRLPLEDMTGGTFTITNGGIFGSMLSTPIINPPQSGILGMHNIVERPVAINGKVEIRPIMYVALSYDHRIIDGRDSVGFLFKIKELIENPTQMLLGIGNPGELLLGL